MLVFALGHFRNMMFYTMILLCSGLAALQQGCITVIPDKQFDFGPYSDPLLTPVGSKTSPSFHQDSSQATAEQVLDLGDLTPSAHGDAAGFPQHWI